ncbi:MAG: TVP38/TMEM64 family protein [Gammaproteobacteria bacterium]
MQSNKLLRIILLSVLLAGITVAIYYHKQFDAAALEHWLQGTGPAAPLLFMAIYILATVLFIPGSVLTLAGGALFGPLYGTFYNLTGATIGATCAFLLARYLSSNWIQGKTGGRLKQLKKGVEDEGWRFVAFVRLVPLFPFDLLNYALGLTRIKLSHYIIASYLCMLPGTFAYTYLGYAGREAVTGSEGMIQKGLLALALLAIVLFLPRLITRMRQV